MGDQEGIAGALGNLAILAVAQGDYAGARILYEEGLALWREAGHREGIAHSLESLGEVAAAQSDHAAGRRQRVPGLW